MDGDCIAVSPSGGSGRGLVGGARVAQVGPIDVGAQVFAAHGALRNSFDGRAPLCWNRPNLIDPLTHRRRGYVERSGKGGLSAYSLAGLCDCIFSHGSANCSSATDSTQAML